MQVQLGLRSGIESFTDDAILFALSGKGPAMDDVIRFLYRAHFGHLSQYVLHNNGSDADAEDLFQEVIIQFIHLVRMGKFRGEASVKTFLYALTRNLWLNELKRKGRAQAREERYEMQTKNIAPHAVHHLEYRESASELMSVIGQLGENCKKILLLFYFENHSMKEILSLLNYENEQVVRNKKYKCLKKMEELVSSNATLFQQLKTFLHG